MERRTASQWLTGTMYLRGVTGRDLARALGKDESTVSNWKNGKLRPNPDECIKIGRILGVDDPMRILVTWGHIKAGTVEGVEPLPIPEVDHERVALEQRLAKIPGMTKKMREAALKQWDKERKFEE